jgi:tetratricopeptide (TPR) repeat protein
VHRPCPPWSRELVAALALVTGAAGCQPPVGVKDGRGPSALGSPLQQVTDATFATSLHRLLREGQPTAERSALLAAVVRRQLKHAGELFGRKEAGRGAQAVVGALYLVRAGEARADLMDASSLPALSGAIERFSARGDEGRALALMELKKKLLTAGSAEANELDRHLEALRQWVADTRTGEAMATLGANERARVARALIEPSEAASSEARKAVAEWIDRAAEINLVFQQTKQLPARDEATEAFRALQSGAYTMAALFLRHGRADAAITALESSGAGRVARPSFFAKVRAAAVDDAAEDWRALARDFARGALDDDSAEPRLEADVLDAVLWGVALEAYRRDPTSLAMAHILAGHLVDYGMPEAAPLVLLDALGRDPSAVSLSGALDTIIDALSAEYESGAVAAARRIHGAAAALLALADEPRYVGQLKTSAAQVRHLMASIELGAGNVDQARPLLQGALRAEPSVWGYTMLGTLERQVGDLEAALSDAAVAASLPPTRTPDLEVADAKLLTFEILRDRGALGQARAALDDALRIVLESRKLASVPEHSVRVERMLARVLDGYGERASAARALERALDLADTNRNVLGPTMMTAIGRALVYQDLPAARAALGLGIKADIDHASLVSGALWLWLLERELHEKPDGKVDRVLVEAVNGDGVSAKLARWARGAIDDGELRKAAHSYSDRVKSEFYLAMKALATGQAGAHEQLKRVSQHPLVELFEVRLARDVLAPEFRVQVPENLRIP